MKTKKFGSNDIISVYKFMEMCGLHCEVKSNIHVSHKIMLRKLAKRHMQFPNVILPKTLKFERINTEIVKNGGIVLVKDDCGNVVPYTSPRVYTSSILLNEEQNQMIREKILQEQLDMDADYTYLDGEKVTQGYSKYLYKKSIKELEEEKNIYLKH